MTQVHAGRIRTALLAKGFVSRHTDHEWFFLKVAGRSQAIRTKLSHGRSKIDDSLLRLMARQLHLTRDEFIELISCTLSAEDYVRLLKERGQI